MGTHLKLCMDMCMDMCMDIHVDLSCTMEKTWMDMCIGVCMDMCSMHVCACICTDCVTQGPPAVLYGHK